MRMESPFNFEAPCAQDKLAEFAETAGMGAQAVAMLQTELGLNVMVLMDAALSGDMETLKSCIAKCPAEFRPRVVEVIESMRNNLSVAVNLLRHPEVLN